MPKQAIGSATPTIIPRRDLWLAALAWIAAYLALQVVGRFVRLPAGTPIPVVLGVVVASVVGFMLLSIAMTAALTRASLAPRAAIVALAGGLALWLGLLLYGGTLTAGGARPGRATALALAQGVDLGRTLAAVGIGTLVAALVRDRNLMLPAAVFAAFADYFMVHYGTVHQALSSEKGQKLLEAMSSKTPEIRVGGLPIPVLSVGMADIVFIAFFLACAIRLELNARGTLLAFAVILPLALLLVLITGWPVPALMPMALAFVLVNWRYFRLSQEERKAVAIAAGVVALATAGFFIVRALR
jgi:hypothetical protein